MNRRLEGSSLSSQKFYNSPSPLRKVFRKFVERSRRKQTAKRSRKVKRDTPIASTQRRSPDPDDFTGSEQRIEIRGLISLDARRKDLALEIRGDEIRALQ